jgi:DNA-directed RNA polymerase specialized sigma24 family protein
MIESVIAEAEPQRSIIERAIAGDEMAFARIVAAHHGDMARISFFVCGDADIAEEAEQAAWAVAYRRLKGPRRGSLRPVADVDRRQRGPPDGPEPALANRPSCPSPTGPGRDTDHAALIDLADALGRLDPRDRAIVGLRHRRLRICRDRQRLG